MPKGLGIPVFPSSSGGARIEADPVHTKTVLRLALSAEGDQNPFQLLGISEDMIFEINDPTVRGRARRAVENIIRKFNDRIARDTSTPIDFQVTEAGRLSVSFRYIDLTTSSVNDFAEEIS